DLIVRERAHLLAVDGDRADRLIILEHRNNNEGTRARNVSNRPRCGLALDITSVQPEVGNMLHRSAFNRENKIIARAGRKDSIVFSYLGKGGWHVVHRHHSELPTIKQQ